MLKYSSGSNLPTSEIRNSVVAPCSVNCSTHFWCNTSTFSTSRCFPHAQLNTQLQFKRRKITLTVVEVIFKRTGKNRLIAQEGEKQQRQQHWGEFSFGIFLFCTLCISPTKKSLQRRRPHPFRGGFLRGEYELMCNWFCYAKFEELGWDLRCVQCEICSRML